LDWDVFFQLHKLATGFLNRKQTDSPLAGYPVEGDSVPIGGKILIAGVQTRYQY
jgi:hypothetical protein